MALGLGTAAFFLYSLTAARDIVVGDTPELTAAALTLGVAHPPGYPLLTLLGHVFGSILPGSLPFRVNLLAVGCSAATVGLVYLTAVRLTRERLWAALAAVLLAVNPLLWAWSLVFEAFPLNNLLAAGIVFSLVRWHETPERGIWLIGAALLSGLGLTNHHSIVLIGPAVLVVLWSRRPHLLRSRVLVPACAGALIVGLLPYAYVPWAAARDPYLSWMGVASVADFFALVMRQYYGSGQLTSVQALAGGSAPERIVALFGSFGGLQLALLGFGAIGAYLWRRWYLWFTALAFVFAGPVFAAYANANLAADYVAWILERFFLLSHVVVAPLLAFGLAFVAHLVQNVGAAVLRGVPRHAVTAIVALPVIAVVAVTMARGYPDLDQSSNLVARIFAEDVLASLEPGAMLIANGDEVLGPLAYLQAVEGHRADVDLVMAPLLSNPWYVRQLRARQRVQVNSGRMRDLVDANQGRRIYVIGDVLEPESLRDAYTSSPVGLVFRIERMGQRASVAETVAENEGLVDRYTPPRPGDVDPRTFERAILNQYVLAAHRIGGMLERSGDAGAARRWYQRALAIDPGLRLARESLDRLGP